MFKQYSGDTVKVVTNAHALISTHPRLFSVFFEFQVFQIQSKLIVCNELLENVTKWPSYLVTSGFDWHLEGQIKLKNH